MKKAIAILLTLVLCIGLCACNEEQRPADGNVIVTASDGSTTAVTAEDVGDDPAKYEGAEITIKGAVEKLAQDDGGWTFVIIEGGWKVIVDQDVILDNGIEVGSVIRIDGNVYDADETPVVIKHKISEDRYEPVDSIAKIS